MTANKPEAVVYATTVYSSEAIAALMRRTGERAEPVVRLADYEALQAECEQLRNLLRCAQPIIRAHAEASHMLEGFRPKRNQWDELVVAIDTAMQEGSHDNQ